MEYSISLNVGITWREDLPDRMRGIDLAFYQEDVNTRSFTDPFLHKTVREKRDWYLSAIAALFEEWVKNGCPKGNPFTSFPRWAEVVGGVMLANGLGDPCQPQENFGANDHKTEAMRCLFLLASDMHKGRWIKRSDIYNLIDPAPNPSGGYACHVYRDEFNWFGPLREGEEVRKNQTRLGITLDAFNGRELRGIKFTIDKSTPGRGLRYQFQKM
jgi:hypothetical protein